MKYLALLVLGMMMLVGAAGALSLDFQNPGDMNSISDGVGVGSMDWANGNGGNSYLSNDGAWGGGSPSVENRIAIPMRYSAVSLLGYGYWGGYLDIYLWDSDHTRLTDVSTWGKNVPVGRLELIMQGLQPCLYDDGTQIVCGQTISKNPSYIGWSGFSGSWASPVFLFDDMIWGDSDSKYVFGMPEANVYVMTRDFTNSAASGFGSVNVDGTVTILSSDNMTTTFSKDNGDNETVLLANTDTGTVYATYYTGTAYTGSIAWDIRTALFESGAPMGRYRTYIPGHGYSQDIYYIGAGAVINFNHRTYSQGDVATISYSVSTGGYWNTQLNTYQIVIRDIYGTVKQTTPLTSQTGSISYTWKTTDDPNVYYALIELTPRAGGDPVLMNFDYTTLNTFTTFSGTVNDGPTGLPIENANVTIYQGSVIGNTTTPTNGTHIETGFYKGVLTEVSVIAPGYEPYFVSITPMSGGTIPLNFTMRPSSPTVDGVGFGGVLRTGSDPGGANGRTITGGYGEPIPYGMAVADNATTGVNYYTYSNPAGWYQFDETHGGTA